MFKQLIILVLLAVAANAWSFTVWTEDNRAGKHRYYFDVKAGNNCFNFDSEITRERVGSFSFCSMAWTRCTVSIHSEPNCNGENLGSATAAEPIGRWYKASTSSKGSYMKSFRIQGCKGVPELGNLDNQVCSADIPYL
ncbi:hypothetical protein BGW38_003982 [Lunasporangiospora selenospora]|uniref:Secreted protein n=1 Tax=Lunasporangiospora selenospora TaxID=979761 RepID=A0A9P6FS03_9FUNG|nr:hypothetical protein BGW38_003982 [Lunasporangiospora selenospora]